VDRPNEFSPINTDRSHPATKFREATNFEDVSCRFLVPLETPCPAMKRKFNPQVHSVAFSPCLQSCRHHNFPAPFFLPLSSADFLSLPAILISSMMASALGFFGRYCFGFGFRA
jgi:hypothetical protein